MKSYTLPAGLLVLASALFVFGMLQSFGRARLALSELAAGQQAAERMRHDLLATQQAASAARKDAAPADRFLESWAAELETEGNIEQIFAQLDTQAVNNLLSPSGKNFTLNKKYFFNGHHVPVQNVNITVAGDFHRTLNWLGAVEGTFPLARVEQVSYTSNGSSLALAVQFVFPRKFASE